MKILEIFPNWFKRILLIRLNNSTFPEEYYDEQSLPKIQTKELIVAKKTIFSVFESDMDIISKRFPIVFRRILNNLDDQSLVRSKEASKGLAKMVENERLFWLRSIKKYNENFKGLEESWNQVVSKTSIHIVKELAIAVQNFSPLFRISKSDNGISPLSIAIKEGSFELCENIFKKISDKNPVSRWGKTALHQTAEKGQFELFRLIFENVKDKKPVDEIGDLPIHSAALGGNLDIINLIIENDTDINPINDYGYTPLHKAVDGGHLEIYQLLVEDMKDKNPANKFGVTPLHRAVQSNNFHLCKLIIKYNEGKNPADGFGLTPLHYAAGYPGNYDICKLIINSVEDKNPANDNGGTPLHYAAVQGHLEICKLIIKNVEDKSPVDDNGKTPKDRALRWRRYTCSSLLTNESIRADLLKLFE